MDLKVLGYALRSANLPGAGMDCLLASPKENGYPQSLSCAEPLRFSRLWQARHHGEHPGQVVSFARKRGRCQRPWRGFCWRRVCGSSVARLSADVTPSSVLRERRSVRMQDIKREPRLLGEIASYARQAARWGRKEGKHVWVPHPCAQTTGACVFCALRLYRLSRAFAPEG